MILDLQSSLLTQIFINDNYFIYFLIPLLRKYQKPNSKKNVSCDVYQDVTGKACSQNGEMFVMTFSSDVPATWFKMLGENSKLKYNCKKRIFGRVLRRHKNCTNAY